METLLDIPEAGLVLRPHREADIQPLFEAARCSIPEISPWMSWCHEHYTIEDAAAWVRSREEAWRRREAFSFVIEETATGELVGTAGLSHPNWLHQLANLGYWVRTASTGRGYATAAARRLARWAMKEQGLTRLEIVVAVGNHASRRVAEKLGATFEGIQRNRLTNGPELLDAWMYSLIPGDPF